MSKRSTRFYRRNEQQVMRDLGFKPTINSGSGDIQKEDGENDIAICQLKSTDAQSISIKQNDLRMLEYHATVSHKVPVFAIQFLNTGEVWLCMKSSDIRIVGKEYIDVFGGEEQNIVDNGKQQEYNVRESRSELLSRAKARGIYNSRKQKEREEHDKLFKERRKERRRRSSNKEE